MISLFDNQINLLLSVQQTLGILKKTDIYRIENGKSILKNEPATYNISNVSGRVNIQSTDQSVNQDITIKDNIFSQIKDAIKESEINTKDKDILLKNVDHLESSVGSKSFVQKYQNLMQSAANHMTIIAPFLPALSKLLGYRDRDTHH